jgi:methionyl-tRNA formyltransferase
MRLVLMGTGPFAVPAFARLIESGAHTIAGVITRPEKLARGKADVDLHPVRTLAKQHGLRLESPESINSDEAHALLRELAADLFVVCDYGQILKPATLELAGHGGINLHGSLLPKYRGAAPIQWAIYQGETETGITVIHMTPRLDGGPILEQVATPIGPEETNVELEPRLARLGVAAVERAIARIAAGDITGAAQDPALVTKAPRLAKTAGAIDWSRTAKQIHDQIRAFVPWPKTYTHWLHKKEKMDLEVTEAGAVTNFKPIEPLRLIIDRATVQDSPADLADDGVVSYLTTAGEVPDPSRKPAPGTIIEAGERLVVQCGRGALAIEQLQPAGKKSQSVAEFQRGHKVPVGATFGGE